MADVKDLYAAFTAELVGVFYPGGPPAPGAYSPVTGTEVVIGPGWPQADQINADMVSVDATSQLPNMIVISIFAVPGAIENLTRYQLDWQTKTAPSPTITATVDDTGTEVTLAGMVSTPQNICILVDGTPALYAVQPGDTLGAIATTLAALVNVFEPAHADGDIVVIPGARELSARVGANGTSIMEVMRQRRRIMLTYWCPTNDLRDTASGPVVAALADTDFFTLADGTAARVITVADTMIDDFQKPLIYRRQTTYSVEYATTKQEVDTEIVLAKLTSQTGITPATAPVQTSYF